MSHNLNDKCNYEVITKNTKQQVLEKEELN